MDRYFTEQQVSEIIRKAAERQMRERPTGTASPLGVSEGELMRVASELGIDQSHLSAAIAEMGGSWQEDTGTINSVDRIIERTIDGEVSQNDLGIVLQEWPAGGIGNQPVTIGSTLSYQSMVAMSTCQDNVSQRNGKTTLRLKSNAFLPTVLPAIFLSIITNVIIWEETRATISEGLVPAILIPAALLTIGYFAARRLIRHSNSKVLSLVKRTVGKLQESADHVRSQLGKSGIPLPDVEGEVEQARL